MTRAELENALDRISDLWAEIDVKPPIAVGRREVIIKQAIVILQKLADGFDLRRKE